MSKALVWTIFIISLIAAVAVPAIVTVNNKDNAATAGLGSVTLTPEAAKGRELFAERCAVCHALAAAGSVGAVGPNLDVHVGVQAKSYAEKRALVMSAILEGRSEDEGQMPADLFVGKEAEEVAAFVSQAAHQTPNLK